MCQESEELLRIPARELGGRGVIPHWHAVEGERVEKRERDMGGGGGGGKKETKRRKKKDLKIMLIVNSLSELFKLMLVGDSSWINV